MGKISVKYPAIKRYIALIHCTIPSSIREKISYYMINGATLLGMDHFVDANVGDRSSTGLLDTQPAIGSAKRHVTIEPTRIVL